jgi:type I restriction enzyme R subunit
LSDGVKDPAGPFLVNPIIIDARTNVTAQLLDDKGYAVHKIVEGEEVDDTYGFKDFEKTFFNEQTNETLCLTFLENAEVDPLSGEIGKTIIFAVSQNHAEKIAQILNRLAMERWPGRYNSDFAVQITSNVKSAQNYTVQFSENQLRGHTNWLEGYDSSKARVAVTVGMMTTGYDCSDLLNVVFMRPIFSPSDFIQMKGRGTRLHTFAWTDYANDETVRTARKNHFKLIDFFAVCEYFEYKYDYDAPLIVPKVPEKPMFIDHAPQNYAGFREPDTVIERPADFDIADALKSKQETIVGADGMKVDREMFRAFQESAQGQEVVDLAEQSRELAKDFLKKEVFDKPKFYLNLEKLRKIFRLNRKLDLDEALDLITGAITEPKSRDAKLSDAFDEFITTRNLGDALTGELYDDAK